MLALCLHAQGNPKGIKNEAIALSFKVDKPGLIVRFQYDSQY